jgi:hypothetical protein
MQALGALPGSQLSVALCVSGSGAIVGGTCLTDVLQLGFVQRAGLPLMDVNDVLAGAGADLSGWKLEEVRSISEDGTVISGTAIHGQVSEAWISSLPSACGSADFNCDGAVGTDADIESFFKCLAGSCPGSACGQNADFNADGDTGTDADIESFFRVLAGEHC